MSSDSNSYPASFTQLESRGDDLPRPTAEGAAPAGRHLLADFYGVTAELLRDEHRLMCALIDALKTNGFHVLNQQAHKFPGAGGVTGLVLLSESHAAFHTYPEFQYVAVDVFSCGMADPHPVIAALEEAWQPNRVQRCLNHRGSKPRES